MSMSTKVRVVVAALGISAAGITGTVIHEDFRDGPYMPTKGDRWTIGYGSTVYEDGTPVKPTDPKITEERALAIMLAHSNKDEAAFKRSLPGVKMYQEEFDNYMDFVYQYGQTNWNGSGMRRELLKGNRVGACEALKLYKNMFSNTEMPVSKGWEVSKRNAAGKPIQWKFDCSTPGNKQCRGVWTRQLARYDKCMQYAVQ